MKDNTLQLNHIIKNGLEYFQFQNLSSHHGMISHCFTSRKGGVSKGECAELNMGLGRKDTPSNVQQNYEIICREMGFDTQRIVMGRQIHGTSIMKVTSADAAGSVYPDGRHGGFDGFVTNIPGITLVTYHADCTPIFLLDPVKKVIALAHSGWRGTLMEIGAEAVKAMTEGYGCDPADIEGAIGPALRQCCFEVDRDVYQQFAEHFTSIESYTLTKIPGKWHIDLQGIIRDTLIACGLSGDKISAGELCTKCRKDLFFSHRGDSGRTGSLAAMMMLK